jgi:hypothetical protein
VVLSKVRYRAFPKSATHCFISQLVTVVHTSRYTRLTLCFTHPKLAFLLCLPAYMCTRVAVTLTATPMTVGLFMLPVSAVAQVLVGGSLGLCLSFLSRSGGRVLSLAWHGVTAPSKSARSVATAVESAMRVPGVSVALVPSGKGDDSVSKDKNNDTKSKDVFKQKRTLKDPMDRLAIACCAFGNTFTLPLVFLVEVLGSIHGDRVAGYIALYLVGWSPTLWTGKGLSQ